MVVVLFCDVVRQVKSIDMMLIWMVWGCGMKYLRQFPGRHVLNRIGRAQGELDDAVTRWEQDQRVSRIVCLLHYRDGLSYGSIAAVLRGGPGWCRRTRAQVRRIVECAKLDCDLLAGANGEETGG